MVAGNCKADGQWVVTPTSIDPLHLSTSRSILISNSSLSFNGRCVITTPLLNSSKGRLRSADLLKIKRNSIENIGKKLSICFLPTIGTELN